MSDLNCSCGATCSQVEALQAEVEELRKTLRIVYEIMVTASRAKNLIEFQLRETDAKV